MKGFGTIAILIVGVVAALYLGVDTMLLGKDIDPSQLPMPNPNEAGEAAQKGANATADEVADWSPLVWRWIVIGVATTLGMIMWNASDKFKGAVAAAVVILIGIVVFV